MRVCHTYSDAAHEPALSGRICTERACMRYATCRIVPTHVPKCSLPSICHIDVRICYDALHTRLHVLLPFSGSSPLPAESVHTESALFCEFCELLPKVPSIHVRYLA